MLEAWTSFFNMGGYAFYVWPAYVITFFVIAANVVGARAFHNNLINRLQRERMLKEGESRADIESQQGERQ